MPATARSAAGGKRGAASEGAARVLVTEKGLIACRGTADAKSLRDDVRDTAHKRETRAAMKERTD